MSESVAIDSDEAPQVRDAAPTKAASSFGLRQLAALVAISSLLTLWSASVPGTYFALVYPSGLLWLALGIVWLFQAIRLARRQGIGSLARSGWLIGTAAAVVLTFAAVRADVPLQLRFGASMGSLEAVAAEMTAPGAPEAVPDRWIGLFDAERIERVEGGFRFLVKGTGFLDPVGFAYSPGGQPPVIGEDRYERFSGPWWIWVESW